VHIVWWGIFLVSLVSLILLTLRNRTAAAWMVKLGIHVVVAAILLFGVNWLGESVNFNIPVNPGTMATVGLLGVPGLLLLVALKVTVV
jgi:inhibitor of the pro-sigma K processing machinery